MLMQVIYWNCWMSLCDCDYTTVCIDQNVWHVSFVYLFVPYHRMFPFTLSLSRSLSLANSVDLQEPKDSQHTKSCQLRIINHTENACDLTEDNEYLINERHRPERQWAQPASSTVVVALRFIYNHPFPYSTRDRIAHVALRCFVTNSLCRVRFVEF